VTSIVRVSTSPPSEILRKVFIQSDLTGYLLGKVFILQGLP
jgi:hypothetical protein